jgi:hypothetical protein
VSIPVGRAVTPFRKRMVMERLYELWLSAPDQRLGQFLENAVHDSYMSAFDVEDDQLVAAAERFVGQ